MGERGRFSASKLYKSDYDMGYEYGLDYIGYFISLII